MNKFEIKYLYNDNYLHAIVSGEDSLENSINYWIDLIEEARLKNYKKVLIEERLIGTLGKSDLFRLNKEIIRQKPTHIKKIAFVDHDNEHALSNSFGTTMLLKEGINVMNFDTKKEALNWLNK